MSRALQALDANEGCEVAAVSSCYRTPPWGKLDQPDFLNAAAAVDTTLSPRAFLDLCLEIERTLKRERGERWGPRLIDLDILIFGIANLKEEGLQVPHPRMAERAFVLIPLEEIAPDLEIAGRPIGEWLSRLDASGIKREPHIAGWWRAAA
ncbi:MAG: 2-amino-4-hydroxy-6-hydroxymethyldihydropteridine diphosphokinase [Methylobacterium mesophilicum]|nr:2-amino-4-hydroxy-6-hydroxymethyldihydropteridine diphosphokinase [Methylobacterium mesophilicum]